MKSSVVESFVQEMEKLALTEVPMPDSSIKVMDTATAPMVAGKFAPNSMAGKAHGQAVVQSGAASRMVDWADTLKPFKVDKTVGG